MKTVINSKKDAQLQYLKEIEDYVEKYCSIHSSRAYDCPQKIDQDDLVRLASLLALSEDRVGEVDWATQDDNLIKLIAHSFYEKIAYKQQAKEALINFYEKQITKDIYGEYVYQISLKKEKYA